MWKFGVTLPLPSAELMINVDVTEKQFDTVRTGQLNKVEVPLNESMKAINIIEGSLEMRFHWCLMNCTALEDQ